MSANGAADVKTAILPVSKALGGKAQIATVAKRFPADTNCLLKSGPGTDDELVVSK